MSRVVMAFEKVIIVFLSFMSFTDQSELESHQLPTATITTTQHTHKQKCTHNQKLENQSLDPRSSLLCQWVENYSDENRNVHAKSQEAPYREREKKGHSLVPPTLLLPLGDQIECHKAGPHNDIFH